MTELAIWWVFQAADTAVYAIAGLVLTAMLVFLVIAIVSPWEAISWWAGGASVDDDLQHALAHIRTELPREQVPNLSLDQASESYALHAGRQPSAASEPEVQPPDEALTDRQPEQYLVHLSGINSVAGDRLLDGEVSLLKWIAKVSPETEVVWGVFPYSVNNRPLIGRRLLSGFWRWVHDVGFTRNSLLLIFIYIRNVAQIGVSADRRYGPIQNFGTALEVIRGLLRHGYPMGSGVPVTILGYSGGGQISLGTVPYLRAALRAPIQVISLGSVMSSDPGLRHITRLCHLWGRQDPIPSLGYLFPGRWPVALWSAWNIIRRRGKIQMIDMGPLTHNGPGSYIDADSRYPDGQSYVERTARIIARLLDEHRLKFRHRFLHRLQSLNGMLPGHGCRQKMEPT